MWKITPDEVEEDIITDEDVIIIPPSGPRYMVIKEVTHNEVRYPPNTILPDDLIRPDGIEWLLNKGAIEISEE